VQTQVHLARRMPNDSAPPSHGSGEARSRAVYLQTVPDATFALVHLPASRRQGTTGVVICPLFGWDDLCTHRSRRSWAQELADAGHPAIRIDLPGTGDSTGSPYGPNQLAAWTSAVSAAASWLRDDAGCSRVCALGIGFGGVLAWLATAEGAPIDDLALWAVPTAGRRLVREIHAGAMLSIDARVRLRTSPDAPVVEAAGPEDGGMLDEAGQVTTKETADSLRRIDLLNTPLPQAERRRVLLFQRTGVKADEEWARHLRAIGTDLTIESGDSYGALMRYVQASEVPHAAIADSISWLGSSGTGSATAAESVRMAAGVSSSPTHATPSVEFMHEGVAIRETPITIDLPSGTVCGILTQPVGAYPLNLCAAFFSGGSDRRIGPNRMWVNQARRWAALGLTAVRVDPGGVGDSDGDERDWDHVRAHYRTSHIDHTIELLDALAARGLPNRFVMVGFCSGGYRSLHVALRDRRVAGVFAIGLPFFRWTWWTSNVRDSWLTAWEPKPGDPALNIKIGRTLQRALRVVNHAQHRVVRAGQLFRNRADHVIGRLNDQGTELVFLLKGASYAHEQLTQPRRAARLLRLRRVRVHRLPGDDQRFRPLPSQQFVGEQIDDALGRIIRSEARATSPTGRDDDGLRRRTQLPQRELSQANS
jgi:dienelactone hydrolase